MMELIGYRQSELRGMGSQNRTWEKEEVELIAARQGFSRSWKKIRKKKKEKKADIQR